MEKLGDSAEKAAESVGGMYGPVQKITTSANGAASALSGVGGAASNVTDSLNTKADVIRNLQITGPNFSGGGGTDTRVTAHAMGGIVSTPHYGLVGEAGPEAIIPLGGSRARAMGLLDETARRLGVRRYAKGAIVGGGAAAPATGGAGGGIQVNLGGQTFTVQVQGGGDAQAIVQALKGGAPEVANALAGQLARVLAQAFSNMPQTEMG